MSLGAITTRRPRSLFFHRHCMRRLTDRAADDSSPFLSISRSILAVRRKRVWTDAAHSAQNPCKLALLKPKTSFVSTAVTSSNGTVVDRACRHMLASLDGQNRLWSRKSWPRQCYAAACAGEPLAQEGVGLTRTHRLLPFSLNRGREQQGTRSGVPFRLPSSETLMLFTTLCSCAIHQSDNERQTQLILQDGTYRELSQMCMMTNTRETMMSSERSSTAYPTKALSAGPASTCSLRRFYAH